VAQLAAIRKAKGIEAVTAEVLRDVNPDVLACSVLRAPGA
jgi:hypothetical protein